MRILGSSSHHIADKRTAAASSGTEGTSPSESATSPDGAVVVHIDARRPESADGGARAKHLEALRASIDDGSYQINFGSLAERLVDEELARAGG